MNSSAAELRLFALQPKETTVTETLPSLNEDVTAEPLHAELQACLRKLIEGGADPVAVVDAALAAATSLAVDVNGAEKTAAMLLLVSEQLRQAAGLHQPGDRTSQH